MTFTDYVIITSTDYVIITSYLCRLIHIPSGCKHALVNIIGNVLNLFVLFTPFGWSMNDTGLEGEGYEFKDSSLLWRSVCKWESKIDRLISHMTYVLILNGTCMHTRSTLLKVHATTIH